MYKPLTGPVPLFSPTPPPPDHLKVTVFFYTLANLFVTYFNLKGNVHILCFYHMLHESWIFLGKRLTELI